MADSNNNGHNVQNGSIVMENKLVLEEMDEDYEDSSEPEDEDELNHRIQKKSAEDSMPRSQTEPPGNLAEFDHEYKGKKKKKKRKEHHKKYRTKDKETESMKQSKAKKPKKQKQPKNKVRSYNIDDVEDVDVESVEDEENEIKRTSTLDMVKNGIMSAKKRLLSPESIENEQEYEHKEIENEQEHKRKKKDSDSLNKKSLNLFSKGKGLFARNGSSKDLMDGNPLNDDLKHNKTSSKSNLSAFKDKLQKFKNKKTSTPKQSQVTMTKNYIQKECEFANI